VPDHRPHIARVAEALREWVAGPDTPVKVVYPLAHRYRPAELSFAALKNEDAAVAAVLEHAATQSDCVLRLAMVSIEESGSAEPIWTGRRGGWRHAEPEHYLTLPSRKRPPAPAAGGGKRRRLQRPARRLFERTIRRSGWPAIHPASSVTSAPRVPALVFAQRRPDLEPGGRGQ